MSTEVRKTISLLGYYFKFNLSAVMEYRASFLIQCFGMALNNSAFIFFWWILFRNVDNIGGYHFNDEMLLWAISSTSFGICHVVFGNVNKITKMALNGELDTYLLQPKDPLVNIVCSRTLVSAWGDMLYGIILFLFINHWGVGGFLMYLLFCVTGALILAAVLVSFHALSFFTGNSDAMAQMVLEFMISFSIYPEGIFNNGVKYILYTVIPTAFIVFVPSGIIQSFSVVKLFEVLAVAVVWIMLAYSLFYKGLKRYESGNLINSRL